MAVYSKLLLSTGGGIVSSQQQAEQVKNTATLLIGLGGTGVHCIRTIKTQVYTRLKPDNPTSVIPEYSHIRFLGVDTAEKSRGGSLAENPAQESKKADDIMALDGTEFFSISNKQIDRVFSEEGKAALRLRDDLSWLDWDHIPVPHLADAGAGGIRQIGRFMMMDKSDTFYAKLEQEISAAKSGLEDPRVNIHIFSGLSGGTGSGCFLDVCYMVRSIAMKMGGVTVFGYLFLPDVNLANVPYENVDVRNYIPKNGYAAMQELDYCMGLPQNGGSFEQIYKGHRAISWSAPPVSMCHLICATDQNNKVIPDAYNYALNVTAEYVMDFLTDSDKEFGLSEHLSNFHSMIAEADAKKMIGAQMAYCVIGASCASLPLREVNTYLASELFARFSTIERNIPSKSDVEGLAISALATGAQSVSDVYDFLFQEIQEGAPSDYVQYPDDWKFVQDYGNHEMVSHYTNQTAAKVNRITANAQSMITPDNQRSLLGRVTQKLYDVIRDYSRGPIYAYSMLSAAESHNFLNLIDGLIRENQERADQEAGQSDLRQNDYENAKLDFERRKRINLPGADQKRFESYEYYLLVLSQHNLSMEVYERLDMVLREFREQVVEITASYYIKMKRVMDTLIETFKENRDALASQQTLQKKESFVIPMMTISELQKTLDENVAKINIPSMLDAFMTLLINNPDEWIQEDENKITRMVTDFFVNNAFSGFAGRTITSFMKDKYENKTGGKITDEQLSNFIYEDWMKLLTSRASPLFYSNNIWSQSNTSKLAFLSFPAESAPVKSAATKMNTEQPLWGLKVSTLTDRIFVMCSACGLPLGSYNNCNEYERMFFSGKQPGRHYYEGKTVKGIAFDDWNKLPSVTPVSVIAYDQAPNDLKQRLDQSITLYEKALAFGILDADGACYRPSAASLKEISNACDACNQLIDRAGDLKDVPALETAVAEIEKLLPIAMEKTGTGLPNDGYRKDVEAIQRIQKDHFCASPGYHEAIAKDIETIETVTNKVQSVTAHAKEKVQMLRQRGNAIVNFANALFTGVISLEGLEVVYHRAVNGFVSDITDVTLSTLSRDYAFGTIPIYQAFVSYQGLDPDVVAEMEEVSNKRAVSNASELKDVVAKLKEDLGANRMAAWAQLARDFVEQREEIVAFIGEINQRFKTFLQIHAL